MHRLIIILLIPIFLSVSSASAYLEEAEETVEVVLDKELPESIEDLKVLEEQIQKHREKMIKSTVAVTVGNSQGSGVVINEEGYVLTAAHVIGGRGERATIRFSDGSQKRAETLGVDHDTDAGVLKIVDEGEWTFCDMAKPETHEVGDWCIVTGHPGGYRNNRPPVIRIGRVNHLTKSMIRTDATLVGGDSGGPVFDLNGKVMGVNSRIGVSTSWNLHVPVAIYQEKWDELSSPAGFLGVGGDPYNQAGPCRLTTIRPDSPAAKAGLKVRDIITKFDDKPIKNFLELRKTVSHYPPDRAIKVEIKRNSKLLVLEVTLSRRDPYEGIR